MQAPNYRWIPIAQAEINKEYCGYRTALEPNSEHFCSITYLGGGKGLIYDRDPVEHITELMVRVTYREQAEFYVARFDERDRRTQCNLYGLFHDLYDVGDATAELWNAWICYDFYETNERMLDADFTLVGISSIAPYPCSYLAYSSAIVAETSDGERIWCHVDSNLVEDWRAQMYDVYNKLSF